MSKGRLENPEIFLYCFLLHYPSTVFPLPARKTRKRAGVDSMKFDELPEKRKHIVFAAGFTEGSAVLFSFF